MVVRNTNEAEPLSKAAIQRLLRRGLDGAVALHGTTTETVLELFRTGHILRDAEEVHLKRRIYFFPLNTSPLMRRLSKQFLAEELRSLAYIELERRGFSPNPPTKDRFAMGLEEAIMDAAIYAKLAEADLRFRTILKGLGIDYNSLNPYTVQKWSFAGSPEDIDIPRNYGLDPKTKSELERLIYVLAAGGNYQDKYTDNGSIIAVNRKISEFEIKSDPKLFASIFIEIPSGLKAHYVSGVLPLNDGGKAAIDGYLRSL